ncbi:MAG: hypothetical protein RLZ22_37 [Verrucomicrobiota bacterium]
MGLPALFLVSIFENFTEKLRNPLWFVSLGIVLLAGLMALMKRSSEPIVETTKVPTSSDIPRNQTQQSYLEAEVAGLERITATPKRPLHRALSTPTHTNASMRISELIGNSSLSHDEIATQLAQIALSPNASEAERLEAMEHGANLGFSHLLPLSLDPNLPLQLAEAYLHGLYGHDQVKEQVSGALGLLNHSEAEIREQAQILLGFLLEAEEDNESPEKLRKKVDEFLMRPDQPDEGVDEVSGQ